MTHPTVKQQLGNQTIDVLVTKTHLAEGKPKDPCRCALALAIRSKTGWKVLDVGPVSCRLQSPSRILTYDHDGYHLVLSFDEGRKGVETTVRLTLVDAL